ncbi:MAG: hypothetical protein AUG51_11355 [Acidobacteria bacterium 13_1_20CM_3_53_8]|nr:MAG: hypothetical protein AUG51_11355 [Acidobacteria bacterium 13_1_20CM_3_53_8]
MSREINAFADKLEEDAKKRTGSIAVLTRDLEHLARNLRESNGVIDKAFNDILDILDSIPGADKSLIANARGRWVEFASIDPPGCPPPHGGGGTG